MKILMIGLILMTAALVSAGTSDRSAGTGAAVTAKGKHAAKAAAAKKETPAAHKIAKEEIGKEAICSVTGDKFKVSEETKAVSYKGKIYYFCAPSCEPIFLGQPDRYSRRR